MTRIMSNLYVGNWNSSLNIDELISMGINTVICLNKNKKPEHILAKYKENKINHIAIGIDDLVTEDISKVFIPCYNTIEKSKRTLIHCSAGVSRSVAVAVMYLMKKNDWSFKKAFAEVKARRTCADPNEGFIFKLQAFEAQLKKEGRKLE